MESSDLTDAQWERLRPTAPTAETPYGSSGQRSPHHPQRHPLDLAHWQSLARLARALRLVEDGLQPLLPLAAGSASGSGSWPHSSGRPMSRAGSTGACISWTAPSSGPTSTRPVPKGDPAAEALGRSRGGYSTKIHLRCERGGKPMVFVLTRGERHEQPVLPLLMERGAVKRPGRGRPRIRPDRVAGERATAAPRCAGT